MPTAARATCSSLMGSKSIHKCMPAHELALQPRQLHSLPSLQEWLFILSINRHSWHTHNPLSTATCLPSPCRKAGELSPNSTAASGGALNVTGGDPALIDYRMTLCARGDLDRDR